MFLSVFLSKTQCWHHSAPTNQCSWNHSPSPACNSNHEPYVTVGKSSSTSISLKNADSVLAFTKTQMPCTIMPQTRWTSLRYPDWESEDVSNKRDHSTEPQPCAYHDVISLSSACTLSSCPQLPLTCVRAGPLSPDKEQGWRKSSSKHLCSVIDIRL